ncbi:hypothetical protein BGX31_010959 [Mortierella sp. GBA43]|nr:hypothetical protein BGX31_010959 [Mortierella sp. GBA43]
MAQKTVSFLKLMVPKVPLIASTTYSHYAYGPPKPSWSYRFSLTVALLRSFVAHLNEVPVRESQALSRLPQESVPVDPRVAASEVFISKTYRDKAVAHVDRLLDLQGIDTTKLGWNWKNDPKADEPLVAEWTVPKTKDERYKEGRTILYLHGGGYILGSITTHRWATCAMTRLAGAKVLSLDYRLAPDSPFPAAVVDAVAAYLFLLNPPADSGATPVDAQNIVIMGDSAGGGLTFATMLAIRDAGLPMPGGIVGLSPWLDLLHSMPSVLTNAYSDYLPAEGFTQGGQGSLKNVAKLASTVDPDDDILKHPDMPEVQYYASNAVLSCPYVSPLVEKSLEGACPMLVIVGESEMLRDEAIVFAMKNADASPILHLSLYDDMPHVFPMFDFLPSADHAFEEAAAFVRSVTGDGPSMANKSFVRVGVDGSRRPLERDAVVGWKERVGKLGGGPQVLATLR